MVCYSLHLSQSLFIFCPLAFSSCRAHRVSKHLRYCSESCHHIAAQPRTRISLPHLPSSTKPPANPPQATRNLALSSTPKLAASKRSSQKPSLPTQKAPSTQPTPGALHLSTAPRPCASYQPTSQATPPQKPPKNQRRKTTAGGSARPAQPSIPGWTRD